MRMEVFMGKSMIQKVETVHAKLVGLATNAKVIHMTLSEFKTRKNKAQGKSYAKLSIS